MADLYKLLEHISLTAEQEKQLPDASAQTYAKLLLAEQAIQEEKRRLVNEVKKEDLERIQKVLSEKTEHAGTQAATEREEKQVLEKPLFQPESDEQVPAYIPVAVAAQILQITPQEVRRKCKKGELVGYQPAGGKGIWSISADNFKKTPEMWREFVDKRNKLYERSATVAQLAIQLLDENLEDQE